MQNVGENELRIGISDGMSGWEVAGDGSPSYKHRVIMSKSIDQPPCLAT